MMKRWKVDLLVEKEYTRIVRAKNERQAIAKAKALVIKSPGRIQKKHFNQFPSAESE